MSGALIHIHDVHAADLHWSFRDTPPEFAPRIDDTWASGARVSVDPCPAYAHDPDVLAAAVLQAQAVIPLRWDVHLFSSDREEIGRSNGHSQLLSGYAPDGEYQQLGGMIWLSGKRIPPHPAMTRHLVAHELGHNVEWMLNAARGAKQNYDDTMVREYATLRGLPESTHHHGGPGTWHDSATEVFACDFRILVLGVEDEYWPHPGIDHPATVAGLNAWWTDALEQLAATPPALETEAA